MKLSRLIDPKFKATLTQLNSQKLPLKAAFKLKTIIKKIDEEYSKYDEVRLASLNRYGKKKDDGSLDTDDQGNVPLEGDNGQLFVNELNELLDLDIAIPTLSVSELGNDISISSEELMLLDFLVE
jgi:hypothetical protein